jgi:hypothetical protein
MIISRWRKISSLLNKKHPFSEFKLWYFIPLKKIKVKKKIQDIEDFRKRERLLFLELEGQFLRVDSPYRKSSLSPFLLLFVVGD